MNNMILISKLPRLICRGLILPVLVLLALLLSPVLMNAQSYSGNPMLPGFKADPDVLIANGKYYIYPTTLGGTNDFHAYSSTDLTNWVDEGVIFDLGPDCSWAENAGWAPTMEFRNGKYYFYYTAETKIGVAVGNSPTGPFTDKGSPLIKSDPFTNDIIDPDVFVDSNGKAYIYYGGSNGSKMVYRELNTDMVSLKTSAVNITPPNYTEAPLLVKRNSIYYMMYSNGAWNSNNYNVQYATSSSPTGPWTYKGQVLSSGGAYNGPGHHGVLKIPGCDEYYIIYHRYDNGSSGRKVAIDRMYFRADGSIARVKMTDQGVLARKLSDACREVIAPSFPDPNKYYALQSKVDGRYVANNGSQDARILTGNEATSRHFRFKPSGVSGYYNIESRTDGDYLGNKTEIGNAEFWSPSNTTYRRWKLQSSPGATGYYNIVSEVNGGYLGNKTEENDAQVWSATDTDYRRWKLVEVGSVNARSATLADKQLKEAPLVEESASIQAYPNPASATLQVVLPSAEAATQLQIQDLQGKTMIRKQLDKSQTLDISGLPAGMYLLRLQQGSELYTKKLMIE